MTMFRLMPTVTAALVVGSLAPAAHAGDALARHAHRPSVEIWLRPEWRQGSSPKRPHERSRRMTLDGSASRESERYDAQYDETRRVRGTTLRELLRLYAPPASVDLAILHFANGMAIPVPFRDERAMQRLEPLVATETAKAGGKEPLSRAFPSIARKDAAADSRPIQFLENKVVVAERWHPDVPTGRRPPFSPWAHADSLIGIELVASVPYFAQFDVAMEASGRRGLALFRENCQFCHRIGDVGATFGWDLLAATRDERFRESAAHLYHNVAFKPRNAPELGLMMPALAFLTEEDAGYLLAWLQSFATQPVPRYRRPR